MAARNLWRRVVLRCCDHGQPGADLYRPWVTTTLSLPSVFRVTDLRRMIHAPHTVSGEARVAISSYRIPDFALLSLRPECPDRHPPGLPIAPHTGHRARALLVLFLDLLWRVTGRAAGGAVDSRVGGRGRGAPDADRDFWLGHGIVRQSGAEHALGDRPDWRGWHGVLGGQIAGQLVRLGRFRPGVTGRFSAGFIMAAVLFLIIAAGIFPLAREGFFAAGSANQGTLLAQAALFAAVWAVAWAALGGAPVPSPETAAARAAAAESISRRSALRGVAAAGLAAGVAYLGWRLAKAPAAGDVVARQQAAAEIAARARVPRRPRLERLPRPRPGLSRQILPRSRPTPRTTPRSPNGIRVRRSRLPNSRRRAS